MISQPGLFGSPKPTPQPTANPGALGMSRAFAKAERVEAGWKAGAIEAVRKLALARETFLAEDVRETFATPAEADSRAWGAVMKTAQKLGLVLPGGYALAKCSNNSPRVLWRSLLFAGARAASFPSSLETAKPADLPR